MTPDMKYPRIRSVRTEGDKTLWVKFDNGVAKLYDCKPLLRTEPFCLLQNDAIFRAAHADTNGYGVIWNAVKNLGWGKQEREAERMGARKPSDASEMGGILSLDRAG